ncbi:sugar transporter [Xinfangfangia sp. D13-10-4-6]|uniref:sugar transporter n=1 Tax=Pseudogemmobacter hezensis TaxID=2737662 RepID=UPI0015556E6A|nr:sugar transporter [Pseudogemmobacter hezensis]NPD14626.1 sugar transporter [Pseudogemmobacter hezensis]
MTIARTAKPLGPATASRQEGVVRPIISAVPASAPPPRVAPLAPVTPMRPGAAPRVPPSARPARFKLRHKRLVLSFLGMVVAPVVATALYLTIFATAQYASYMAFTVRSEGHAAASAELMGGFGALLGGSPSGNDGEILQNYILSQEMVAKVSARMDLPTLFSVNETWDPVFSYHPGNGTIEAMTAYWKRMVHISHDSKSGIIELEITAFSPEAAQEIAKVVHEESTAMINNLSATAREDSLRYAAADLDRALDQVKSAREAITEFRMKHQIVDVAADVQGQYGIINGLQQQLATALVEYDLLRGSTTATDPRLPQVELRIQAIRDRIADERQKVGYSDGEGSYATIASEYERLTVEREFAEALYVAAMSQHEMALTEAKRQTRYLATHIQPTLAQSSEYPRNGFILASVLLFSFLIWSVMGLIYYAVRDRN